MNQHYACNFSLTSTTDQGFCRPLLLSTVARRRSTTAIFSTPALIDIVSPNKLSQTVSSTIQRHHSWLNSFTNWHLRLQSSQVETDANWRELANSTTFSRQARFCLRMVASSTTFLETGEILLENGGELYNFPRDRQDSAWEWWRALQLSPNEKDSTLKISSRSKSCRFDTVELKGMTSYSNKLRLCKFDFEFFSSEISIRKKFNSA
jgi:hypothetical protein